MIGERRALIGRRLRFIFGLIFAGVAAFGLLASCSSAGSSPDFEFGLGDCLWLVDRTSSSSSYQDISCDQPHNYEVVGFVTVGDTELRADGTFPGSEAVQAKAEVDCEAMYREYASESAFLDDYTSTYWSVSEGGWEAGKRDIMCMVDLGFARNPINSDDVCQVPLSGGDCP